VRTSSRRPSPFAVSRYGVPLDELAVRHQVNTGIRFGSELFPLWNAAIAAGATLSELEAIDQGGRFSGKFLAKVMAWKRIRDAIELHSSDAQATAAERKMKRGR